MRASEGKNENSHWIEKREKDVPSMNHTKQRTFVCITLSYQIKSNNFISLQLPHQKSMLLTNTFCPLKVAKHQFIVACKQALRSGVYLSWQRASVAPTTSVLGRPFPNLLDVRFARRSPQIYVALRPLLTR